MSEEDEYVTTLTDSDKIDPQSSSSSLDHQYLYEYSNNINNNSEYVQYNISTESIVLIHKMQEEILEWLYKMKSDPLCDEVELRGLLQLPPLKSYQLMMLPSKDTLKEGTVSSGIYSKDGIISGPIEAYDQAQKALDKVMYIHLYINM